jgi:hypothetical protein
VQYMGPIVVQHGWHACLRAVGYENSSTVTFAENRYRSISALSDLLEGRIGAVVLKIEREMASGQSSWYCKA